MGHGRAGAVRADPVPVVRHAGDHHDRPRHHSRRHPGDLLRVFSFLTKPIDQDELLVTIEHALSLTRPKQQQGGSPSSRPCNPQMEKLLIQASSIATMDVPC